MRTLFLVLATAGPALAQVDTVVFRPMHLFGDHMVVPAATRVPIGGFGVPQKPVDLATSWGAKATTNVDAAGHWRSELTTPARGGPFEITLKSAGATVTLHDVLIGDVWLCSGQSNMEMPVGAANGWKGGVRDSQREIAAADHPTLRVFTVAQNASASPATDVEGSWQVCSPATVAAFSASAYFFGRELVQRGKGPIGLVVSAWGGTVCEAWTSETGLRTFPEFAAAVASLRKAPKSSREARLAAFWTAVQNGKAEAAVAVQVPELWSKTDLRTFDGVATYTREVEVPVAFRGKVLVFELGALDDMDTVWWNGVRIGGHEDSGAWSTARRYTVPASSEAKGSLVVRVVDTGGEGGFSGAPTELRLFPSDAPGRPLPLAGTWQRQRGPALADLPAWPAEDDRPNRPTVLWNGMLAPLVPFPFTGALWYQGEANHGRAEQYARLVPAMIADWRAAFGRELPFYFVQLAPFGYDGEVDGTTPLLREAQAAALAVPGTGMAVTLDCGDAKDIHPADKQPVGQRLARLALARHYGESVACEGPRLVDLAKALAPKAGALRLSFETGGGPLVLEPGVSGFEVAGADGTFHAALARIDGTTLEVWSLLVAEPRHVRYAWSAAPTATLRNGEGLPAPPFRASLR